MILLSLNIRGVGGASKFASLRSLLEKTQPTIIFLQETLVNASAARHFMHRLRPNWLICAASSVGTSGGLLAAWDPTYFDLRPMLCPGGILLTGHCFELRSSLNFLNVYGPCTDRKAFWERLDDIGLLAAKNLIIAGDLNLTTSQMEIWGEKASIDPHMSFFNRVFYKNNLVDVKPAELLPTWRNGRQGSDSIAKRLDRFLVSDEVISPARSSRAWVNLPFTSDHAAICLQIGMGRFGKGQPFIFNPLWLKEISFNSLVRSTWEDFKDSVPGDPQGNLIRKLKHLQQQTTRWLKDKKLAEKAAINKIDLELEALLRLQLQNPDIPDINYRIKELERDRSTFLREDEERWRLKSRMLWLNGGDKNTRFFHRFASARRSKKQLWDIEQEDGITYHAQEEIKVAAVNHFNAFFQVPIEPSLNAQVELAGRFPNMVTAEEALALESPCTKEEILSVLKGFKKEKSPGPDGWSVELYLHFFDIMGQDLLDVVEDARLRGVINPLLNSTFLVLIPKSNHPKQFKDFRPISLCNLCYKLISKIIANRIRPILSKALSEEQLGFLKGRQILDVVGVAQECIHTLNSKKQQAILLKLDLKQAFDCVNWNFLHLILLQSGFGVATTNWILGCISSATMAVLINGEPTKSFRCERGLRQGCPLSPLLFIFTLEALSILLKSSQAEGHLTGVNFSGLSNILHILFVDDVLILTKASLTEWALLHSIIHTFCTASGLVINLQKSLFLALNTQEPILTNLKNMFGIDTADLKKGFSYLGFYIKSTRYSKTDWLWLLDKFESRIHHWCNKHLSLGGRYILIKAVLESLPVYWMALTKFPATVLSSIRKLIFSFLWTGSKLTGYHLCNWEVISKPKKMGGWGLKNLPFFQRALLANTLWRILMKPGLWSKVIKAKYFPQIPVHLWLRSTTGRRIEGSHTWRNLLTTLPIILHWLSWKPGNGYQIEVGRDVMLGLGKLALLSTNLLEHLHRKNIFFLFQIKSNQSGGHLSDCWLRSEELGLDAALAVEWNGFTRRLMESGVRLLNRPDLLLWTGGDRSGALNAKNVYSALAAKCWSLNSERGQGAIWRCNVPLKLKLFAWLLIENKLLLWPNLQARGWEGPSRCCLCNSSGETSAHLFIDCSFSRSVWNLISPALTPTSTWTGTSVSNCFQNWSRASPNQVKIPILLCWLIWKNRNAALFEDKPPSVHRVACSIFAEISVDRNQIPIFNTLQTCLHSSN
jgi:exonuclease III